MLYCCKCSSIGNLKVRKHVCQNVIHDHQAMLKAKYCPRAMPVQHFVNPGQLYVTGTQPPLAPPSECVCCMSPHCLARYPHSKKTNVTLTFDLWPWYSTGF